MSDYIHTIRTFELFAFILCASAVSVCSVVKFTIDIIRNIFRGHK